MSNGVADDPRCADRPNILQITLRHQFDQIKTDNSGLRGDARDQVYDVEIGQAARLRQQHAGNDGRIQAVAVDRDQAIRAVLDCTQDGLNAPAFELSCRNNPGAPIPRATELLQARAADTP